MIRVKLEEVETDDTQKDGQISCSVKNRGYDETITLIDDPLLKIVSYSLSDPVGNPIEALKRKPSKKNPSYSTIDADPGQYVPVDTGWTTVLLMCCTST